MNHEYVIKLQRGCAFLPCYLKGRGKATKICFEDGGFEYLGYSVSKVINDYFAINMISMESTKKLCQFITGKKCMTPLYMREGALLIPVKTMKPCTRGDKCIGYINVGFIEDVNFDDSLVKLKNGQTIKYLDSRETIKKRIGDCTLVMQKASNKKNIIEAFKNNSLRKI